MTSQMLNNTFDVMTTLHKPRVFELRNVAQLSKPKRKRACEDLFFKKAKKKNNGPNRTAIEYGIDDWCREGDRSRQINKKKQAVAFYSNRWVVRKQLDLYKLSLGLVLQNSQTLFLRIPRSKICMCLSKNHRNILHHADLTDSHRPANVK